MRIRRRLNISPVSRRNSEYREALYIGYRYYDTAKVKVLYPFGFGLSYTKFEYSDLEVSGDGVGIYSYKYRRTRRSRGGAALYRQKAMRKSSARRKN